jgi:hypothetical protein
MAVAAQIKAALDRLAKGRQNSQANFATGTDFWALVDAAADETYENRVKGTDMTALDAALASGAVWSTVSLKKWFESHNSYMNFDLGLAHPYFDSYLATVGWRVPWEAAEAHYEALNLRISPQFVFPKGTRPADGADPAASGMHKFGRLTGTAGAPTWAAVDGALSTSMKGAPILITNEDADASVTDLVMRCTLQDGTTKDITVALAAATQHAQTLVGAQAIGAAGAAAGQKVVPVAATTQFKASEWVLIVKADFSVQEVAQIDSLVAATSITVKSNLINSWVEDDLVLPMFTSVTHQSGTVANTKKLGFWAYPDRIIAL